MKKKSPSQKTANQRMNDLKDLPTRRTLKELHEKLLFTPDNWWKDPEPSQSMLRYVVEYAVAKGKESLVKSYLQNQVWLDMNSSMSGKVHVVHAGKATRIDCEGNSVLGSEYTVIKDGNQGTLFLDRKTESFLGIPKDLEIKHYFKEKLKAQVVLQKPDQNIQRATINITYPYRIRYELWLDISEEFKPYRQQVVCHTIGCADQFAKIGVNVQPIVEAGVPVKGEVYMPDLQRQEQMISSFVVNELKLESYNSSEFIVTRGYRSLKELSREAKDKKQRQSFGPKVRLSDIRPQLKRPLHDRDMPTYRHSEEKAQAAHESRMALTHGRFQGGNFEFPTCFNATYASLIANVVDQKLLDDVKYLVNGVSKRLSNFSGTNGEINIPWMDQFKAHSDAINDTDPGGGLYVLMHDETPMDASYLQKKGLLDRLAVNDLGNLLRDGNNLIDLSLIPALQARVNTILADPSIAPENRFSSFTLEEQGQLIDAYVFKKIGTLHLTYPESTGTQRIFHDLLDVRLDNIAFDININNTAILTNLAFDADSVHMVIDLPDASGKAFMSRWPTEIYWAAVGVSALACLIFPPACALLGAALIVGVFIGLDFAFVSLELENLNIDAHIRLLPNASNVLQPDVQLSLDADVSAFYMSVVPTGVHQILSLIYMIILNATDLVINNIESQLQSKLNDFLKKDLDLSYPPKFGPVPLLGINNSTEFVANDRAYIEQGLNAGTLGVINPYITQVDAEVKPKILQFRDAFKANFEDPVDAFARLGGLIGWVGADFSNIARYYLGTVLSQNFINHYVYTLWRIHTFNYAFNTDEKRELFEMLKLAYGELRDVDFDEKLVHAHLWPAVPPRTVFTPKPASEGLYYSTTFFDDVRLCISFRTDNQRLPNKIEFLFAAQTYTEIGFGAFNAAKNALDILKVSDRAFDIYFDLRGLGVRVIHPEVESFRVPDMVPSVSFDYSLLDATEIQTMFVRAMQFALATRNADFIPRGAGDDQYMQRYPIGDDALQLVCQLVPFQGNLYISKGISGPATAVVEGALDIDTMDKFLARLIMAFV